ncbi:MAG: alkaline phosphatase [Ignavibacteria bacterium]
MKKIIGYITVVVLTLAISYLVWGNQTVDVIGYKGGTYYSSNSKLAHLLLNRTLADESHFAWSTGNHTASPVPCGAVGQEKYIKKLNGLIQNTDIGKVTHEAIKEGQNVILVIGDGMGMNHMSLPIYMRIAEKSDEETYFEKILNEGSCGITLTNPVRGLVTGSATSATSLATGIKSYLETVGIDTNGYPLKSSIALAKENNYSTAIITDAGITDGTPAAFYAHSYNRDLENNIAAQLINHKIDIIFGGGAARFIPEGTHIKDYIYFQNSDQMRNSKSDRNDDKNLLEEFVENGYQIVSNKNDLLTVNKNTDRLLGLFAPGGLAAAIDRDIEDTGEPSLVQMAEKAFEILNHKKQNYFIMIEAARIDWEAHDNDGGSVYRATEEMNELLGVCYNEYQKNKKKTLLIFTADHETGGLSISYTKRTDENKFVKELKSGDTWTSKTDPLLFENFLKLKKQKRAIHRDFGKAKSAKELYELLKDNIDYEITLEDAEVIFNTRKNYKKGK